MALAEDAEFAEATRRLFEGPPGGRLVLPSLVDVAGRLDDLELRLTKLEGRVDGD